MQGAKHGSAGVDAEEIQEALAGASDEVFEGYMMGLARAMSDELRSQRTMGGMADSAQRIAGSQQMRDKLAEVLPKRKDGQLTAQSERFMRRLERTRDMTEFGRQTFGGSRTTPLSESIKEATEGEGIMAALADMAEAGTRGGGKGNIRQTGCQHISQTRHL